MSKRSLLPEKRPWKTVIECIEVSLPVANDGLRMAEAVFERFNRTIREGAGFASMRRSLPATP